MNSTTELEKNASRLRCSSQRRSAPMKAKPAKKAWRAKKPADYPKRPIESLRRPVKNPSPS